MRAAPPKSALSVPKLSETYIYVYNVSRQNRTVRLESFWKLLYVEIVWSTVAFDRVVNITGSEPRSDHITPAVFCCLDQHAKQGNQVFSCISQTGRKRGVDADSARQLNIQAQHIGLKHRSPYVRIDTTDDGKEPALVCAL